MQSFWIVQEAIVVDRRNISFVGGAASNIRVAAI
jgi:hypothetical protein